MNWFNTRPFWIKLLNREYWPMWITYLPVYPYYLYLAARARSFFFFSAANPSIETGGMIGEPKMEILDLIDDEYKPVSIFIPKNTSIDSIIKSLRQKGINYPIILKPNVGERGLLVQKIEHENGLRAAIAENNIDRIIQPFITLKEEFAIMYYRFPHWEQGKITSVTQKKFLTVIGDGTSTLKELIRQQPRAILQWETLKVKWAKRLTEVLPKGTALELVPIGNHAKGTMFLNGNHLIDEQLERVFDKIAKNMQGVYFGRFDLKCSSVEDLKLGRNIQIMEFNGVGSEPAHIYDPNYSLWATYRDLLHQWKLMFEIGTYVHKKLGVPYMTLHEARHLWKKLKSYRADLNE